MDDTLMIFFLIAAIVWIQVLTPPKLGLPPQKQSVSDREPFIHTKATEALSGSREQGLSSIKQEPIFNTGPESLSNVPHSCNRDTADLV